MSAREFWAHYVVITMAVVSAWWVIDQVQRRRGQAA